MFYVKKNNVVNIIFLFEINKNYPYETKNNNIRIFDWKQVKINNIIKNKIIKSINENFKQPIETYYQIFKDKNEIKKFCKINNIQNLESIFKTSNLEIDIDNLLSLRI
jgi:hypothetical protein